MLVSVTLLALLLSATQASSDGGGGDQQATDPYVVVLGIAQDGGVPQAGCRRACCASAWSDPSSRRLVACLALVDPRSGERWLFEATPDFREQLHRLDEVAPTPSTPGLSGIFITHAHIGHYTGLMHVGHEAMGARAVPVYAMPRLRAFLSSAGPWDQLVRYENISLRDLRADEAVQLNERLRVTPLRVPHREEYSEVVGFRIDGPRRSVLFIPDIDKWDRWDRSIEELVADVDVAYLDGTFFDHGELPNRDMSGIPHPFIAETMERFEARPAAERARVRFIHLNHTNPALRPDGDARRRIEASGFRVADELERVGL
ncbi:MAG: MBL fold metallo-hydrolase [Planctomycetota bacterium]|jgi:pyrroloquinoline quinone biosynthesis protein B